MPTVRPSEPISLLADAPMGAPRVLVDGRLVAGGQAEALRQGTVRLDAPTALPVGTWNGRPLLDAPDGTRIHDTLEHNGRLYVAFSRPDREGLASLAPDWPGILVTAPPVADGAGASVTLDRPSPDPISQWAIDRFAGLNIQTRARIQAAYRQADLRFDPLGGIGYHVGYLCIPYNERGEAGPWSWVRHTGRTLGIYWMDRDGTQGGIQSRHLFPPVRLRIPVSPSCSRVDLYKTFAFVNEGSRAGRPFPQILVWQPEGEGNLVRRHALFDAPSDALRPYFVARLAASDTSSGRVVEHRDAVQWMDASAAQGVGLDLPARLDAPKSATTNDFATLYEARLPDDAPLPVPNLSASDGLLGRTAYGRRMVRDGSATSFRVVYGDVTYPAQSPRLAAAYGSKPVDLVAFVHEYQANGRTYLGPPQQSLVGQVRVAASGAETALRVYVRPAGGNTLYLYERLVAQSGEYRTAYTRPGEPAPAPFAFDGEAYNAARLNMNQPYPGDTVDAVRDEALLALSAPNAPLTIELGGSVMPGGRRCRALMPLSLARAEAVRSYAFASASDRGIFLHRRDGDDLLADAASAYGIVERLGRPVLALSRDAAYMAVRDGGTDRLARVQNGQVGFIDIAVQEGPERLWAEIHALAAVGGEVLALTDTGLWIYDELRQGITGGYDHPFGTEPGEADLLWLDGERAHLRVHTAGGPRRYVLDGSGPYRTARLTTQPLDGASGDYAAGVRLGIKTLLVDYDRADGDASVTHRVERLGGGTFEQGEHQQTFSAPPGVRRFPTRLRGRGHTLTVAGFKTLRAILTE